MPTDDSPNSTAVRTEGCIEGVGCERAAGVVDGEGSVGALTEPRPLGTQLVGRPQRRAQVAQAAGVGDGGGQLDLVPRPEGGEEDRQVDAEQVLELRAEPTAISFRMGVPADLPTCPWPRATRRAATPGASPPWSGVAAALALGAHGAVLGTRFLATGEMAIDQSWKERIVTAAATDTLVHDIVPAATLVERLATRTTAALRAAAASIPRIRLDRP